MTGAAELDARVASIEELANVVTAIRSLAAGQLQSAERALPAIRRYADITRGALAKARSLIAAPLAIPPELRSCLVVVCSERGFVGALNERLIDRVRAEPEAATGRVWVIGARGIQLTHARRMKIERTMPMAAHAAGVLRHARSLADEVERQIASGALGPLAVLAARHAPGEPLGIERRQLLPLTAPAVHSADEVPPLHHLAPLELFVRMLVEYLHGELAHVLMEAFASESAARLQAMESARRHIEDKLRGLRAEANRLRQEEITSELLDVITGAEAAAGTSTGGLDPHRRQLVLRGVRDRISERADQPIEEDLAGVERRE